jgi:hypothetical protein
VLKNSALAHDMEMGGYFGSLKAEQASFRGNDALVPKTTERPLFSFRQ